MQSLNKWRLIHTYNSMAFADKAEILRCPDDDMPYYTRLDHDNSDEPVFHCLYCQSNVTLGSHVWDQILQVVRTEYDVELSE